MAKRSIWLSILVMASLVLVMGCELGQVDQGRVIAFDEKKGTVTLIQDKDANPGKPNYNTLPPHTYIVPKDPKEMGPDPKAGGRMKLDLDKKIITIFDPETQKFKDITFTVDKKEEGVSRENPLVAGKTLPAVDKDKGTLAIYSGRQKLYVVIKLPPEEVAKYPLSTWDAGDEVRIYFKEPGKALRLMNISKTDIFKK